MWKRVVALGVLFAVLTVTLWVALGPGGPRGSLEGATARSSPSPEPLDRVVGESRNESRREALPSAPEEFSPVPPLEDPPPFTESRESRVASSLAPARSTWRQVSGEIVDATTGLRCKETGAVHLASEECNGALITAQNGVWQGSLPPGQYRVIATAGGKVSASALVVTIDPDSGASGVSIPVVQGARLRIIHEGTSWAAFACFDGVLVGLVLGDGSTDMVVPPGEVTVVLEADTTQRRIVNVDVGQTLDVSFP